MLNQNENTIPTPTSCETQEVLTLREAAEFLRINVRSLQRLMRADAVPYARLGRSVRFRRTKLLAWLDDGGTRAETLAGGGATRGQRVSGRRRGPDVLDALAD